MLTQLCHSVVGQDVVAVADVAVLPVVAVLVLVILQATKLGILLWMDNIQILEQHATILNITI